MTPIDHKLGRGNGTIREFADGTAEYRRNLSAQFRVRISDVRGFSRTKGPVWAEGDLHIVGQGANLATVAACSTSASKAIEDWFRSHPLFKDDKPQPKSAQSDSALIADELRKLANLKAEGILTEAEFNAQKQKLLSR